jgi:predicted RNase H-like HicB family nuclease
METRKIVVRATWDPEARVWSAASDDVYGLAAEAETFEELMAVLDELIPELVDLNGLAGGPATDELPVSVVTDVLRPIRVARA